MAYKILWYSIPSLLDTSSGAAIRCRLMLSKLQERGIEVKILTASVADDPKGFKETYDQLKGVMLQQLAEAKAAETDKEKAARLVPNDYVKFHINNMEYCMVLTDNLDTDKITAEEQNRIYSHFIGMLEGFQPDVVMGYSGDLFSVSLRREAQARGFQVVYALCNGSHLSYSFSDCDMVFTTSKATQKLYKDKANINVETVGNFIEPSMALAKPEDRNPYYVTLINPIPAKGIAIFIKLILAYYARHPDSKQQFLIVKSRGNFASIMHNLHDANGALLLGGTSEAGNNEAARELEILQALPMIDLAEHTRNIAEVYALTKVLVAPSLWHESWGRVATEATLNGIPVLATDNGGLPEAMGGAGVGGLVLPIPKSCEKDFYCLPTDEEIAPWVDALERLLEEDWSERCQQAAEINSIDKSVDRLYNILLPYLKKGNANKKPFGPNSAYHNAPFLAEHARQVKETFLKAQAEAKQNGGVPTFKVAAETDGSNAGGGALGGDTAMQAAVQSTVQSTVQPTVVAPQAPRAATTLQVQRPQNTHGRGHNNKKKNKKRR